MMHLSLFDYHLPKQLIAQTPANPRDSARLFVLERNSILESAYRQDRGYTAERLHHHDIFFNLGRYLKRGDILVRNVTKVFPARLYAKKETGGVVEILLLRPVSDTSWECLAGGKVRDKTQVKFDNGISAIMLCTENRTWIIDFGEDVNKLPECIREYGYTPIPPYINSPLPEDELRACYQTVYARKTGSVAAPTAGMHFTDILMGHLTQQGVEFLDITLHVGIGTFLPVKSQIIEKHTMHAEFVEIEDSVAHKICSAKQEGRRVIAVGTTTTRALESTAEHILNGKGFYGDVNIFITPGYQFKVIDGLITNFHLPKSTLLMLVSALVGRQGLLQAYQEGIVRGYRFYSFGDAMLII